MEFTCNRCELTCCGVPAGAIQLYPICEDCFNELHNELMEDKGMTFTEAIQKYKMITNDGGKTVYRTDRCGTIFRKANGCSVKLSITVDLLTSTGWEEYKDEELILPKATNYGLGYYTINSWGRLVQDRHLLDHTDGDRLRAFNYFVNKEFAQYVADKQLIQRIELTLTALNKDKFSKEELTKLINKYLRDNYMEVLDRIIQYEL